MSLIHSLPTVWWNSTYPWCYWGKAMTLKFIWVTYPDLMEFIRKNKVIDGLFDWSFSGTIHTLLSLPIYTESTPKAKRRIQTNKIKHATFAETDTYKLFRRTFSETGVISQTGVGVYCTSVYKKERPARWL